MDDLKAKLDAEYMAWFAKLQALTDVALDPDAGWIGRWYDGYSPAEALEDGPEDDL